MESLSFLTFTMLLIAVTCGGEEDNPLEVIGFDCSGPGTEVTAVSLSQVKSCPPPGEYGEMTTKHIQVVQAKQYEHLQISTCLIKVKRHATYCGAGSHSAEVQGGHREYIKFIGREACKAIHDTQMFQFSPNFIIDNIKPNSTTSAQHTLVGSVNTQASCNGGTYSDLGLSYNNVLVVISVTVTISDYNAYSSIKGGDLHLRTGDTCLYKKGYCVQYDAGEIVWDSEPRNDCRPTEYDVLYEGVANYTVVPGAQNITYAFVADGKSVFALQLVRKVGVCGQEGFQTEHDRILIIEKSSFGYVFRMDHPSPLNVDPLAYYNTKASAQEITSLKRVNDLQARAIYGRCKVKRDLMITQLAMARSNPEAIIKTIKSGPGYSGAVYGDVLFISRCQPVAVLLRNDTNKCYNQLAVTWRGESWFLADNSKILVKHAEEVTCSRVITPTHNVHGIWVAFSPQPGPARLVPEVLAPETDQPLAFRPMNEFATGGLYSDESMRELQSTLAFPNARAAVLNVITKRLMGDDASIDGYNINNIFSTGALEALSQSLLGKIGYYLYKFGDICSILIGLACLGYIIKLVLDVTFYGHLLYEVFGCGWAMVAGVCTGLSGALLHREHRRRWSPRQAEEGDVRRADAAPLLPIAPVPVGRRESSASDAIITRQPSVPSNIEYYELQSAPPRRERRLRPNIQSFNDS